MRGIVRFGLSEVILGMAQEIEVLLWLDAVRKWGQFYNWTPVGAKALIGKAAAVNPDSDLVCTCAQTL